MDSHFRFSNYQTVGVHAFLTGGRVVNKILPYIHLFRDYLLRLTTSEEGW